MAYEVTILATGGGSATGVADGVVVGSMGVITPAPASFFAWWVLGTPDRGPFPVPLNHSLGVNLELPPRVNNSLFASASGSLNDEVVAFDVSTPSYTPFKAPAAITSAPVDINENDLVLLWSGQVYSLDQLNHTATFQPGRSAPQKLLAPPLGLQEYFYFGLNDVGDVVGVGVGGASAGSGLFYSVGNLTLYTVPGCLLYDINKNRFAVGWSPGEGGGYFHACFIDLSHAGAPGAGATPLEATLIPFAGTPPPPLGSGEPMAVNNSGVVVGTAVGPGAAPGTPFPFVYFSGQAGAEAQNLNSLASIPGYTLATACDIDDSGQIVGMAHGPDGDFYPYIATPVPPASPHRTHRA